jgi:hypothetical protein
MFIQGVTLVKKSNQVKKAKKLEEGAFASFIDEVVEVETDISAQNVNNIASVGSLLALQEIDEQTLATQQNISYGEEVLDKLDKYRKDIILGNANSNLQNLQNDVKAKRKDSKDPVLNNILDEIEIRALVEQAKKERG